MYRISWINSLLIYFALINFESIHLTSSSNCRLLFWVLNMGTSIKLVYKYESLRQIFWIITRPVGNKPIDK